MFYWGSLWNLDTTKDVRPAPINPIRPANKMWAAKVTRKCHVPRYYHGLASQGISMSTLAQTPLLTPFLDTYPGSVECRSARLGGNIWSAEDVAGEDICR